jgi:hypothetical protein
VVKPAIQKPGMRKVCKACAGNEIKLVGSATLCASCGGSEFIELSFVEQSQYRKDLIERARMKKFSFYHCDELHAAVFIVVMVLVLFFWIYILHSLWGLW